MYEGVAHKNSTDRAKKSVEKNIYLFQLGSIS